MFFRSAPIFPSLLWVSVTVNGLPRFYDSLARVTVIQRRRKVLTAISEPRGRALRGNYRRPACELALLRLPLERPSCLLHLRLPEGNCRNQAKKTLKIYRVEQCKKVEH